MYPHPNRWALLLVGASLFLLAACASAASETDSLESELQSGTVDSGATTSTRAESTSSAAASTSTESTTTLPAIASEQATEFKTFAERLPGVADGVTQLAADIDPARVDVISTDACSSVSADMSDTELGVQGLSSYDDLGEDEQAITSLDDWVVFYGALLGFFCPENLPDFDLESAPSTEGSEVEQFRALITQVDGVSTEAAGFVSGLSDARLDELQGLTCDSTSDDMSTEQFGLVIVGSYNNDLDTAERDGIGLAAYSELFGAVVGWFCASNLPL